MDLIIQAPALAASAAESIAGQCGAASLHALDGGGQNAWRLVDVRSPDGVPAACARARCDYALVPAGLARSAVRVVAMDMDSTLITIECIDEIADLQGIRPAVAAITASAMRGEIDFRESLTRRVALLAGLPVSALAEVYEVATFYHHFEVVKEGEAPPPKLTVRVCDSIACELAGARELLA